MKEGDARGKENITREMTDEADYEKLLENASDGNGVASPTGTAPYTVLVGRAIA